MPNCRRELEGFARRYPGATLGERDVLRTLERRLAKFKLPKRVLFVDELPRNAMGKVQKASLRQRYETLYQPRA